MDSRIGSMDYHALSWPLRVRLMDSSYFGVSSGVGPRDSHAFSACSLGYRVLPFDMSLQVLVMDSHF